MFRYKINVIQALKDNGYSTYVIQNKKYLSAIAMQHLRKGEMVDTKSLNAICCMLRTTPDKILEFTLTDDEKIKYFI